MDRTLIFKVLKERMEKARKEGTTPPFNLDKLHEAVKRLKAKREEAAK